MHMHTDTTAPNATVSSTTPSLVPLRDNPLPVAITFDEPVRDFALGDLTATGGSLGNFSQTDDEGAEYEVYLTPSGDGALAVSLASAVCIDLAANENLESNELQRQYDGTVPTLQLTTEAPVYIRTSPILLNISASEPTVGLTEADVHADNAATDAFVILDADSEQFSLEISPTDEGDVAVHVPAQRCTDIATNPNDASNTLQVTGGVRRVVGRRPLRPHPPGKSRHFLFVHFPQTP